MAYEKGFNFYDMMQLLDNNLFSKADPRLFEILDLCFKVMSNTIELNIPFEYIDEKTIKVVKRFSDITIYDIVDINDVVTYAKFKKSDKENEYIITNESTITPESKLKIHIPETTIKYDKLDNNKFKLTYEDGYIVNLNFHPNGEIDQKSYSSEYPKGVEYMDMVRNLSFNGGSGYTSPNFFKIFDKITKPYFLFDGNQLIFRMISIYDADPNNQLSYSTDCQIYIHKHDSVSLLIKTNRSDNNNDYYGSASIYSYMSPTFNNSWDGTQNTLHKNLLLNPKIMFDNFLPHTYDAYGSIDIGDAHHLIHDNDMYYIHTKFKNRFKAYKAINV